MEKKRSLANRLVCYFAGLFVVATGIALSVKSGLGVSPVSSLPYTVTKCTGLDLGIATTLFHCVLVLLQFIILKRNFKLKILLQVPVGVLFGMFTSLCNYLMTLLPSTENLALRLCMTVLGAVTLAIGIFLYIPPDLVPLAVEGIVKAIADTAQKDFSRIKLLFDVTMVSISLIICLFVLHNTGSVGIGTIISALLIGTTHGLIKRLWAKIQTKKAKNSLPP